MPPTYMVRSSGIVRNLGKRFCNLFRIAAIIQGIAKRVVDGTAASSHAAETGERAKVMAELGWQQVENILKRTA